MSQHKEPCLADLEALKEKVEVEQPIKVILDEHTPMANEIESVVEYTVENAEMIQEIISFSTKNDRMLGLASVQCSYKGRRIKDSFFAVKSLTGEVKIFFNPKIVKTYGEAIEMKEYCLTWTSKAVLAKRFLRIDVMWVNEDGNLEQATVDGLLAQVWQHEIQHLSGINEVLIEPNTIIKNDIGRNNLCPCGSGKKYKKCHGK